MEVNSISFKSLYKQAEQELPKRGLLNRIWFNWNYYLWGQSGKAEIVANELFKEMNDFKPNVGEPTVRFIDICKSISKSESLHGISTRVSRAIQNKLNDLDRIIQPYRKPYRDTTLQMLMEKRSENIKKRVHQRMEPVFEKVIERFSKTVDQEASDFLHKLREEGMDEDQACRETDSFKQKLHQKEWSVKNAFVEEEEAKIRAELEASTPLPTL